MAENQNQGTELDKLLARKAKADSLYAKTPTMALINVKNYLNISDRINLLEIAKFACYTAPETLNPDQIFEHFNYIQDFLKRNGAWSQALIDYVNQGDTFFNTNFHPHNVEDYKQMLRKYISGYTALSKKEQGNKKN